MRDERAIERDKMQALNLALGYKHAGERIACRRFRLHPFNGMTPVDRQEREPDRLKKTGEVCERHARIELAETRLDRDFP